MKTPNQKETPTRKKGLPSSGSKARPHQTQPVGHARTQPVLSDQNLKNSKTTQNITPKSSKKPKDWSKVDEASWESFPASDPPAISPSPTRPREKKPQ